MVEMDEIVTEKNFIYQTQMDEAIGVKWNILSHSKNLLTLYTKSAGVEEGYGSLWSIKVRVGMHNQKNLYRYLGVHGKTYAIRSTIPWVLSLKIT